MANKYKDEKGHWTTKENDGGPCKHSPETDADAYANSEQFRKDHENDFDNDYDFDKWDDEESKPTSEDDDLPILDKNEIGPNDKEAKDIENEMNQKKDREKYIDETFNKAYNLLKENKGEEFLNILNNLSDEDALEILKKFKK